jgi:hypothetical protein
VRELPELISLCDIVVNANRESYLDLSLLEYMSLGKVVVYTAIGGSSRFSEIPQWYAAEPEENSLLGKLVGAIEARLGPEPSDAVRSVFQKTYTANAALRRWSELAQAPRMNLWQSAAMRETVIPG